VKIGIISAGSMGTAIGFVCALNGHEVFLWSRNSYVINDINHNRRNSLYLPNLILPPNMKADLDINTVVRSSNIIILAVPSRVAEEVLLKVNCGLLEDKMVLSVIKGFVNELTVSSYLRRSRSDFSIKKYSALTGPNFATEIANKKTTISVVGSHSKNTLDIVKKLLENDFFKVLVTDDVIGVEISGVLKNIIALTVGIIEGLDLGENLKGYLFAEAMKEALDIGVNLFGASFKTLLGPACLGDAVATSFSNKSRNKLLGLLLAKNVIPHSIKDSFLTEGIRNVLVLKKYLDQQGFNAPLISSVASVIEGENPSFLLDKLLVCAR